MIPKRVILTQRNALGDSVMLSAIARALVERGHEVSCQTACNTIFAGNPHLLSLSPSEVEIVDVPFNLFHISEGEHKHLVTCAAEHLGIEGEVETKPWLFLTDAEKKRPMTEPYVLIARHCSAYWPTKHYPWWQSVVDAMPDVQFVQMGDNVSDDKLHGRLSGTIDKRGRLSYREMMRWVAHASAVACGITSFMHFAAAFDVPTVCIAGGNELPSTFAYPSTRVLSSIGKYDCCLSRGCFLRECPVAVEGWSLCKYEIEPEIVVSEIESVLSA